jgi:hypothetical protein
MRRLSGREKLSRDSSSSFSQPEEKGRRAEEDYRIDNGSRAKGGTLNGENVSFRLSLVLSSAFKNQGKRVLVLVEADDNIALCRYFSLNLFVFQSFSVKPRNRARIFWVASLNQIELLGYFSSNVLIFVYNFPSVTELFKPGPLWVPPAFFFNIYQIFFRNGKDFFIRIDLYLFLSR